ncbi:MAG: Hsp20/alpha crystallin family protein [Paludibacteraceae bacterium]|nr:Hsp20/alpha crystallin family protein [Paludibacteraceae bacterium]
MLPVIKLNDTNRMSNWWNDFFSESWPNLRLSSLSSPAVNIAEDEEHYHVDIAAPGRSKEDFQLHLQDQRTLLVTLHQKEQKCDKKEGCKVIQREFCLTRFEQTISLPEDVDTEQIKAKMEHGVLHITLPKMDEEKRLKNSKMIEIA